MITMCTLAVPRQLKKAGAICSAEQQIAKLSAGAWPGARERGPERDSDEEGVASLTSDSDPVPVL